jgi:hypothetical protein
MVLGVALVIGTLHALLLYRVTVASLLLRVNVTVGVNVDPMAGETLATLITGETGGV